MASDIEFSQDDDCHLFVSDEEEEDDFVTIQKRTEVFEKKRKEAYEMQRKAASNSNILGVEEHEFGCRVVSAGQRLYEMKRQLDMLNGDRLCLSNKLETISLELKLVTQEKNSMHWKLADKALECENLRRELALERGRRGHLAEDEEEPLEHSSEQQENEIAPRSEADLLPKGLLEEVLVGVSAEVESELAVVGADDGEPERVVVGADDGESERVVVGADDGEPEPVVVDAGLAGDGEPEPVVMGAGGGEPEPVVVDAGLAGDGEPEPVVMGAGGGEPEPVVVDVGLAGDGEPEPVVMGAGGGEPEPVVVDAGLADNGEPVPVVVGAGGGEPEPVVMDAGLAGDGESEPVVVGADDGESEPMVVDAGLAGNGESEPVVVGAGGGEPEPVGVDAGLAGSGEPEPVVVDAGNGKPEPVVVDAGDLNGEAKPTSSGKVDLAKDLKNAEIMIKSLNETIRRMELHQVNQTNLFICQNAHLCANTAALRQKSSQVIQHATQMAILQRRLEDHDIALTQSILDRRELERQNRYLRHDLMRTRREHERAMKYEQTRLEEVTSANDSERASLQMTFAKSCDQIRRKYINSERQFEKLKEEHKRLKQEFDECRIFKMEFTEVEDATAMARITASFPETPESEGYQNLKEINEWLFQYQMKAKDTEEKYARLKKRDLSMSERLKTQCGSLSDEPDLTEEVLETNDVPSEDWDGGNNPTEEANDLPFEPSADSEHPAALTEQRPAACRYLPMEDPIAEENMRRRMEERGDLPIPIVVVAYAFVLMIFAVLINTSISLLLNLLGDDSDES